MNFAITGKKIVSPPQPEKKTTQLPNKSKVETKPKQVIKPIVKKPSISAPNKPLPAKKVQKKQEIKQQQPKITPPQVKQQSKLTKIEQPPKLQPQPSTPTMIQPPKISQILVRYNHYKDKFPTQNNILHYQVIQDKYGFANVFKGNYQPRLQIYRNYGKYVEPLTRGTALQYTWEVQEGKDYQITIAEDQLEESKYEKKVYIAPKEENKCCFKKNQRVVELTQEMRNMAVEQLGSQKHKELLEQRALEEVLYS